VDLIGANRPEEDTIRIDPQATPTMIALIPSFEFDLPVFDPTV